MLKPRSSYVEVDNVHLHYLEWDPTQLQTSVHDQPITSSEDEDALPVVLLHGLSATAESWCLVAEHLYTQHPVVALDLRGHGLSDRPDTGYDLLTIAEDTVQGMAALGLGQVVLVGHGWGARVALVLAARHPALVSHLVLVDCPHIEPRHWPGMTRERFLREKSHDDNYTSLSEYNEAMRSEMSAFWSPDVEAIVQTYVKELPDGHVEERLRPEHQLQIREAVWDDRAVLYYGKLHCPVLLIPAAAEPLPDHEPPERLESASDFAAAKGYMAAQVARAIQHCTVLWMPNSTHNLQLQHPEVIADAITDFVRNATI